MKEVKFPAAQQGRPGAGRASVHWTWAVMLGLLSACGGGGSSTGDESPTAPEPGTFVPEPGTPGAQAGEAGQAAARTFWAVGREARFTLRNASGATVSGPLSCTSQAPQALEVAPDCSQVKGLRLGTYAVTVSGGGISAPAPVKVIPPAQPLATDSTSGLGFGVLAVTAPGRLLAWGGYSNWPGAGFQPNFALPTQVASRAGGGYQGGLVASAHGSDVTLALSEDGQVYSWGLTRTLGRQPRPSDLDYYLAGEQYPGLVVDAAGPLRNIVAISTAASGAVALTQEGGVYAWGPFSTSAYPIPDNKVPQLLTLPTKAVALSAGQNWAAILLANGRVMTLRSGPGQDGQFNGTGRPATPGVVGLNVGYVIDSRTGQPLEGIVQVAAGGSYALALTRDGQVMGWGRNEQGQLAQGHAGDVPSTALPLLGPDGSAQLGGIVMVAAGYAHGLALSSNGQVYSWGTGSSGELGDGMDTPRSVSVVRTRRPELVLDPSGTTPLLGGVRAVYASSANSMALMSDGRVLIWGLRRDLGQGPNATGPLYQGLPLAVRNEANSGPLLMTPLSYWPDLWRRGVTLP